MESCVMKYHHFWFVASDQEKIFMHVWDDVENARGVVQLVHGMAEHGKRYEHFASFLNACGYIVYADDHRGHGMTARTIDKIGEMKTTDFMRIVADEIEVSEMLKAKYQLPLYVIGHSFGSFITQRYMIERSDLPSHVILIGSGSANKLQAVSAELLSGALKLFKGEKSRSVLLEKCVLGNFNARIPDAKTPYAWVCSDENELQKYATDPFCGAVFSIGYYNGLAHNLKKMYSQSQLVKINKRLPITILAGSEDPVGGYGKALKRLNSLYQKAGLQHVYSKFYEKMRHEILNEIGKEEVYDDIVKILDYKFKKDE